jgi:hypothetical protein
MSGLGNLTYRYFEVLPQFLKTRVRDPDDNVRSEATGLTGELERDLKLEDRRTWGRII